MTSLQDWGSFSDEDLEMMDQVDQDLKETEEWIKKGRVLNPEKWAEHDAAVLEIEQEWEVHQDTWHDYAEKSGILEGEGTE